MGRSVHDYHRFEREYLNDPKLSLRELARRHDVSWSAVALYARNHGWKERRDRIVERTEEKLIEQVSTRAADVETDMLMAYREEALGSVREAIARFRLQLLDPKFQISPDAYLKIINQGLLLLGQPTARTEERKLELTGTVGELPPELLRRLVEVTRPTGLDARPAISAPRPGPEPPRSN